MSLEFQKTDPTLHAQTLEFMHKFHGEGLISTRRTVHEVYDICRRFILSQKRDVGKAEESLRRTLTWRRDRQIDTLLDDDRKVCLPATEDLLDHIYPHGFHGVAAGSRSVYFERSGFVDRDVLAEKISLEELELHYSRIMERAYQHQWQYVMRIHNRKKQLEQERLARAAAKAKALAAKDASAAPAAAADPAPAAVAADASADAVSPFAAPAGQLQLPSEFIEIATFPLVFIFDLEGMGVTDLTPTTISYLKCIISTMQTYYPNSLYKMLIVNAAFYFSAPWDVVKAFIDPDARAKIDVIGSDFKEKLEAIVPANALPAFLGGTCRSCASPDCIPIVWKEEKARLKAEAKAAKEAEEKK